MDRNIIIELEVYEVPEYGVFIVYTNPKRMLDANFRYIDYHCHSGALHDIDPKTFQIMTFKDRGQVGYKIYNRGWEFWHCAETDNSVFYKQLYDRECRTHDFVKEDGRFIKRVKLSHILKSVSPAQLEAFLAINQAAIQDIRNYIYKLLVELLIADTNPPIIWNADNCERALPFPL